VSVELAAQPEGRDLHGELRLLSVDGKWRFTGNRGDFAALTGHVGKDVLAWLQEGLAEIPRADWDFNGSDEAHGSRMYELGKKIEIMGQLTAGSRQKKMLFSKDAGLPHFPRWRAWRAAFVQKNAANFKCVDGAVRAALATLPKTPNLTTFMTTDAADWAAVYGCMQILRGLTRCCSAKIPAHSVWRDFERPACLMIVVVFPHASKLSLPSNSSKQLHYILTWQLARFCTSSPEFLCFCERCCRSPEMIFLCFICFPILFGWASGRKIAYAGGEARQDPAHYDGGPSFIQLGITLWGHPRTITLECSDGDPNVELVCDGPGHIYMSSLCGPYHRVTHSTSGGTLWSCDGLGTLETVLLCRSAIFQSTRGSIRPNPIPVFSAALGALLPLFAEKQWLLPTLAECRAVD